MTSPPCNQASFVQDVSIPNGTVLPINQAFTKIWRLKNTGSCTWTSSYKLVFVNGDSMGSPVKQSLTSNIIRPNEVADVSVNLAAPASAGTYRGSWKIQDPAGITFGAGIGPLEVGIDVERLIPTPMVDLPDLTVTQFTISPNIPIKKQPVHVQVGIYNQGDQPASQFTVFWYGLSSFSQPSCTWDVLEIISPNSEHILECDFVFQSPYPVNKTSLVIVDPSNHVAESNESNNQGAISPFGVADH
jgi:hypothetical protein